MLLKVNDLLQNLVSTPRSNEVAPMTKVPSKPSNMWTNEDEEEDDDFDENVSLGCMARYVNSPIG